MTRSALRVAGCLLAVMWTTANGTGGFAADSLLTRLQAIPGLEVLEMAPENGFPRQFQIDLTQPVDHQNPQGPQFQQRMYLSHRDTTLPMVFITSGYTASKRRVAELATLLPGNQLDVAHRYMEGSVPEELDWQYLTIEQAAADHHRIVGLLKEIYPGDWVSTGGSKSGLAALYHKRFYPDDVTATVAYAAPLMTTNPDPRIAQYLEGSVGDSVCRERIREFQRDVLSNRSNIIPYMTTVLESMGGTDSLGVEFILQLLVLEYPFYFWSTGDGDCGMMPENADDPAAVIDHLGNFILLWEFTDPGRAFFLPVYYQLFTEIGYYGHMVDHLMDLLDMQYYPALPALPPQDASVTFKPEVMEDILAWLETEGDHIIYLYGEQDPWTAAAISAPTIANTLRIIQPGANHYIRIVELDERDLVVSTLEDWLDLDIDIPDVAIDGGPDRENRSEREGLPLQLKLYQNHPNPFNAVCIIRYDLPHASMAALTIYDMLGREVAKPVDGFMGAGYHHAIWNARTAASGIYIARLATPGNSRLIKMILLK